MNKSFAVLLVMAGCLAVAGCKKSPPPIVETSGRVTLNGAPLPHAAVEFMPELKDFGAEWNSTAVTDEKGEFTLTCANGKPGAVVATHRVLVTDSTPDDMRGSDSQSQARAAKRQSWIAARPHRARQRAGTEHRGGGGDRRRGARAPGRALHRGAALAR